MLCSFGSNFLLAFIFTVYFKAAVSESNLKYICYFISILVYLASLAGSFFLIIVLVSKLENIDSANTWFFTFISAWVTDAFILTGIMYFVKLLIFNNCILTKENISNG